MEQFLLPVHGRKGTAAALTKKDGDVDLPKFLPAPLIEFPSELVWK